jgi:hypothetical protein
MSRRHDVACGVLASGVATALLRAPRSGRGTGAQCHRTEAAQGQRQGLQGQRQQLVVVITELALSLLAGSSCLGGAHAQLNIRPYDVSNAVYSFFVAGCRQRKRIHTISAPIWPSYT